MRQDSCNQGPVNCHRILGCGGGAAHRLEEVLGEADGQGEKGHEAVHHGGQRLHELHCHLPAQHTRHTLSQALCCCTFGTLCHSGKEQDARFVYGSYTELVVAMVRTQQWTRSLSK